LTTPQQVYSLNTNTAGDRQQRSYLTEDTAVVTMKFADTSFGNLIASKVFGPEQEILKVYGKDKILTVSNARFIISDGLGRVSEESEYDDNELIWHTALLENFALSTLLPDKNKLCSTARENLNDMAVIEAAYLSARTGMPEEPARILKMAQAELTNIRPAHK
jgi:predicted dehydrogenase